VKARLSLLAVLLASALFVHSTSGQPRTPSTPPGGANPTMRVHFIDVGQGAATLVEFPCAAVLIDTGGEANGEFDSTDSLLDYLDDFFSRRVDLKETFHALILTHPHIDHTRGVSAILGKAETVPRAWRLERENRLRQARRHDDPSPMVGAFDQGASVGHTAMSSTRHPFLTAVVAIALCPPSDVANAGVHHPPPAVTLVVRQLWLLHREGDTCLVTLVSKSPAWGNVHWASLVTCSRWPPSAVFVSEGAGLNASRVVAQGGDCS